MTDSTTAASYWADQCRAAIQAARERAETDHPQPTERHQAESESSDE